MGYTRINDTTVVDDETGQQLFMPAQMEGIPGAGPGGTQFVQDLPGGARDNTQMSQQEMADYINAQNDKRFLPDAQIPLDPYAEAPRTGPNVPGANELINPYSGKTARVAAKDAKKVKISEKTSGPNGEVRGNTDPYSYNPTGKDFTKPGLDMLANANKTAEGGLNAQQAAAAGAAEVNKAEFNTMAMMSDKKAAMDQKAADDYAARAAKRAAIAQESHDEAVKRVKEFDKESKEAASTEVDPSRFWNSRSTFQKISFIIGAAAGGMVQHIYHNNAAMDILNSAISQDIAAQTDQKQRYASYLKDKRANIDLLNNLDRLQLEDFDAGTRDMLKEYDIRLAAVNNEIEGWKNRYGADKVDPELLNMQGQIEERRGQIRAGLGNVYLQEGQQRRTMEFQKEEAAKSRAAQFALAKQQHEWAMAVEKQKALNAEKLAKQQGMFNTSTVGGFMTGVDANGNPVKDSRVQVQKGLEKEFVEGMRATSHEYVILQTLKNIMKDEDLTSQLVRSKDKVALLNEIAMTKAKAMLGGQLSDQDIALVRQTVIGATSGMGEVLRPGDAVDIIDQNIKSNIERGNQIMELYTVNPDPNAKVIYDPEGLFSAPGNEPVSQNDVVAELAGKYGATNRAKPEPNAIPPDALRDRESYKSAVDVAYESGDVATLTALADTMDEIVSNGGGKDTFQSYLPRGGGRVFGDPKGLVHYAREKANKLQALEAAINKYNEKHQ